jgi:hypothetical protein
VTYWTDRLLDHMQKCPICIGAKIAKSSHRCTVGKTLILMTLKERHGDK